MRYGDTLGTQLVQTFSDISSIAAANNISRKHVKAICLEEEYAQLPELAQKAVDRQKYQRQLDFKEHMLAKDRVLANACKPDQLKKDAAVNLEERAAYFSKNWEGVVVKAQDVSWKFKKEGIKKKKMATKKTNLTWTLETKEDIFRESQQEFLEAKREGRRVVFVDEALFTRHTILNKAFDRKGSKITIN